MLRAAEKKLQAISDRHSHPTDTRLYRVQSSPIEWEVNDQQLRIQLEKYQFAGDPGNDIHILYLNTLCNYSIT